MNKSLYNIALHIALKKKIAVIILSTIFSMTSFQISHHINHSLMEAL